MAQLPYNLITRSIEDECLEYCQVHDVGLVVYNALAGGYTGNQVDKPVEGSRFDYSKMYFDRYLRQSNFKAVDALQSIAEEAGLSPIFTAVVDVPTLVDSILELARSPRWSMLP